MKVLLASDAWPPQVNGVVRTMMAVMRELEALGHTIVTLTPEQCFTAPCPFYREIRLAVNPRGAAKRVIEESQPDAIHIVTEGPIGIAVRRWCLKRGLRFTTAYHTRFPEYLAVRCIAPQRFTYALLRRFHAPAARVMVATETVRRELASHGFRNLAPWGRGVDPSLFDPAFRGALPEFERPIFLSVGRIAHEKNLPAFLGLDLPGSKLVVGEGPALAALKRRFPEAHFLGRRENRALAAVYASADVFVFPSRTDTFGLVMLEALASGVPVAAYPVPGPLDVIDGSGAGALDEDLGRAALAALGVPRARCREHALSFTWSACAQQFLDQLCPAR
ncbi:MAG TPA: glycosyltransferase family 1 protein [Stellaceae bacterium]|nr:glycosyltransferase family 1 protein [Stellaceae bacterium]